MARNAADWLVVGYVMLLLLSEQVLTYIDHINWELNAVPRVADKNLRLVMQIFCGLSLLLHTVNHYLWFTYSGVSIKEMNRRFCFITLPTDQFVPGFYCCTHYTHLRWLTVGCWWVGAIYNPVMIYFCESRIRLNINAVFSPPVPSVGGPFQKVLALSKWFFFL